MKNVILAAWHVNGKNCSIVAAECGVTGGCFYKWSRLLSNIPVPKRQSLERALGVGIDWKLYAEQYQARQNVLSEARKAPPAPDPCEIRATDPTPPVRPSDDVFFAFRSDAKDKSEDSWV
jgi:hypothetical protein